MVIFCSNLFVCNIGTSDSVKQCDELNLSKNYTEVKLDSAYDSADIPILKKGDIILLANSIWDLENRPGHSKLYLGYEQGKGYKFIESIHPVKYSYVSPSTAERIAGYNFHLFIRVNATDAQRENACDFAERQLGKDFQFYWSRTPKWYDSTNESIEHADEWYCSELIWAAYYNCNNSFPKIEPEGGYVYGEGIDIDYNGWELDSDDKKSATVLPEDIYRDNDVYDLTDFYDPHTISVKVRDSSKTPIKSASVSLIKLEGSKNETLETKETGVDGCCEFKNSEISYDINPNYNYSIKVTYNKKTKTEQVPKSPNGDGFGPLIITLSKSNSIKQFQFTRFIQNSAIFDIFLQIIKHL